MTLMYGQITQSSGASVGKDRSGSRDNREKAGGNFWEGKAWHLDQVWVTEVYAFVKTQGMLYLRFVHFTIFKKRKKPENRFFLI